MAMSASGWFGRWPEMLLPVRTAGPKLKELPRIYRLETHAAILCTGGLMCMHKQSEVNKRACLFLHLSASGGWREINGLWIPTFDGFFHGSLRAS